MRVERTRRQVGTDQLSEEFGAPLPRRKVSDAASLGDEIADDRGPQPVDGVRRHRVGDLERDDATAVQAARQPVQRLERAASGALAEALHGPPDLLTDRSDSLPD